MRQFNLSCQQSVSTASARHADRHAKGVRGQCKGLLSLLLNNSILITYIPGKRKWRLEKGPLQRLLRTASWWANSSPCTLRRSGFSRVHAWSSWPYVSRPLLCYCVNYTHAEQAVYSARTFRFVSSSGWLLHILYRFHRRDDHVGVYFGRAGCCSFSTTPRLCVISQCERGEHLPSPENPFNLSSRVVG